MTTDAMMEKFAALGLAGSKAAEAANNRKLAPTLSAVMDEVLYALNIPCQSSTFA
jgi:hypothetical protein